MDQPTYPRDHRRTDRRREGSTHSRKDVDQRTYPRDPRRRHAQLSGAVKSPSFQMKQKSEEEIISCCLHVWAFAGHSRLFWVGIRGAFAGIRGHSRVWCRSSLLTASTHKLRCCPGFSTLRLSGMPPEVMQKKPEILVEQTLYIILLAKIDTAACGDAGVVRSVLLRILPRMFFPFCLPPTCSSDEISYCSVWGLSS